MFDSMELFNCTIEKYARLTQKKQNTSNESELAWIFVRKNLQDLAKVNSQLFALIHTISPHEIHHEDVSSDLRIANLDYKNRTPLTTSVKTASSNSSDESHTLDFRTPNHLLLTREGVFIRIWHRIRKMGPLWSRNPGGIMMNRCVDTEKLAFGKTAATSN